MQIGFGAEIQYEESAMGNCAKLIDNLPFDFILGSVHNLDGINISGPYSDGIEKFFQFGDTDILFPEFVSSKIYAGLLKESLVPQLISMETILSDGVEYRKIYINDTEAQRQTGVVGNRPQKTVQIQITHFCDTAARCCCCHYIMIPCPLSQNPASSGRTRTEVCRHMQAHRMQMC